MRTEGRLKVAAKKNTAKPVPQRGRDAILVLEKMRGGPLTFGEMIHSLRVGDELSLSTYAQRLGVSRQYLCDVEKGRRIVSAGTASAWAKKLGHAEAAFVKLALQAELDAAGVPLVVSVSA
jgi:plasmid maintenance system antidote protein VapI